MCKIQGRMEGGKLVISISGQINSINAAEFKKETDRIRAENPSDAIVLDFDKLEFTSSAGLRVILRIR